jgi:hypothetical protein
VAETDGKLIDFDARPLGGKKVPELVPEHDETDAKDH